MSSKVGRIPQGLEGSPNNRGSCVLCRLNLCLCWHLKKIAPKFYLYVQGEVLKMGCKHVQTLEPSKIKHSEQSKETKKKETRSCCHLIIVWCSSSYGHLQNSSSRMMKPSRATRRASDSRAICSEVSVKKTYTSGFMATYDGHLTSRKNDIRFIRSYKAV